MPTRPSQGVKGRLPFNRKLPACRDDPDAFFPLPYSARNTAEAKRLCRTCPLRRACLEWVAEHPQDDGVYAAMTPKEREGLAGLLAAAGDTGRLLRWFDDREALLTVRRVTVNVVDYATAKRIVGSDALERARLVRRFAPELVEQVMCGVVSLRDAAVRAQANADAPVEIEVAA